MIRNDIVWAAALATAGLALGCGGEEVIPPVPGNIVVSFFTPNSTDGAVLFTVTGPGLTNLAPASSSARIFTRLVAAREVRVIVVGNLGNGPLFTMDVPNTNDLSAFSAMVNQVADLDDDLRESLADYRIDFPLPVTPNPNPSVLDPNP